MGATYEFWLCDDYGRRLYLFKDFSFVSYSRSTQGYGTFQLGIPYDKYLKENLAFFKPDWRVDIWRSPMTGIPARREGSYLLRKPQIYQRESDSMRIMEFYGRSPIDILRRQHYKGTGTLTDNIDDIMKAIVRAQFVTTPSAYATAPVTLNGGVYTYTGEFAVDADSGDGPSVSDTFYLKNVLDACDELKKSSQSLNFLSSTNKKIYFDVVEDDSLGLNGGFGYRFKTYPSLRGRDRTTGLVFSTENENIKAPVYYEDYLDEYTSVFNYNASQTWGNQNVQSTEQYLSRWNYIEKAQTNSDDSSAVALNDAYATLQDGAYKRVLNCDFINSPGSQSLPRSLYGLEWDLGDLLPVIFAEKFINCEVAIVYVSLDDHGNETITGKTQVGA